MTKKSKNIAIIVVIIVLICVVWLWYQNSSNNKAIAPSETGTNAQNTTSSTVPALTQGTSDQVITQDVNSIDQQLNGVSSDTASVNQSLNQ
jgi:predicted negative regulator of RcsB-dependent stress response